MSYLKLGGATIKWSSMETIRREGKENQNVDVAESDIVR